MENNAEITKRSVLSGIQLTVSDAFSTPFLSNWFRPLPTFQSLSWSLCCHFLSFSVPLLLLPRSSSPVCWMCVWCVCVRERERVREREKKREMICVCVRGNDSLNVCICVCACVFVIREREFVCVCVCVCVKSIHIYLICIPSSQVGCGCSH